VVNIIPQDNAPFNSTPTIQYNGGDVIIYGVGHI